MSGTLASRIALAVVAAVLLGLLAFLFVRSAPLDMRGNVDAVTALRQLRAMDASIDLDAVRLVAGLGSAEARAPQARAQVNRLLSNVTAADVTALRTAMLGKIDALAALEAAHARTVQAQASGDADAAAAARAAEVATLEKFGFLTTGARADLAAAALLGSVEATLADQERWRIYLTFYAGALLIAVGYLVSRVTASRAALAAANAGLELRVEERTRELSEAMEKLKESEAQLVQTEKMSSLGQMVAGVAHEINTPLAYVKNSVVTVRDRIPQLRDAIAHSARLRTLIGEDAPDPHDMQETFELLSQRLDALEKQRVLDDLEALTRDGLHGIEQIGDLVVNLKNFSRLDRSRVASFDLNEGVTATLLIAKAQLGGVRVDKRLGRIPAIECSPSQVNQVLLNIVTNAVQAMDKPDARILVVTRPVADGVAVEIADNGKGIPQELVSRIFDPFFTTKDVGKGTGLGLSIAYKIVSQHGGRIDVRSRPGAGTTFTIVLPLHPPAEAPVLEEAHSA